MLPSKKQVPTEKHILSLNVVDVQLIVQKSSLSLSGLKFRDLGEVAGASKFPKFSIDESQILADQRRCRRRRRLRHDRVCVPLVRCHHRKSNHPVIRSIRRIADVVVDAVLRVVEPAKVVEGAVVLKR